MNAAFAPVKLALTKMLWIVGGLVVAQMIGIAILKQRGIDNRRNRNAVSLACVSIATLIAYRSFV